MLKLWVEAYRPRTIEDFVWASPNLKACVTGWMAAGQVPNILLSGGAGRGKTSLARLLPKALGIPKCDILDINASLDRRVDEITDLITNFTSTWAMGDSGVKYIILDEADRLSPLSQDFLRNEIEKHHETCRFILTCNNRQKITGALHSRLQEFEFASLNRDEAVLRAADILISEGVQFDPEVLIKYVEAYHPDLRKCINVLQQRSMSGTLEDFDNSVTNANEWLLDLLAYTVTGDSRAARNLLNEQATPDDYLSIFRFIFTNIEVFEGTDLQDSVLIAVRDGMWRHTSVGDTEINMAATLTEITQLVRKAK